MKDSSTINIQERSAAEEVGPEDKLALGIMMGLGHPMAKIRKFYNEVVIPNLGINSSFDALVNHEFGGYYYIDYDKNCTLAHIPTLPYHRMPKGPSIIIVEWASTEAKPDTSSIELLKDHKQIAELLELLVDFDDIKSRAVDSLGYNPMLLRRVLTRKAYDLIVRDTSSPGILRSAFLSYAGLERLHLGLSKIENLIITDYEFDFAVYDDREVGDLYYRSYIAKSRLCEVLSNARKRILRLMQSLGLQIRMPQDWNTQRHEHIAQPYGSGVTNNNHFYGPIAVDAQNNAMQSSLSSTVNNVVRSPVSVGNTECNQSAQYSQTKEEEKV